MASSNKFKIDSVGFFRGGMRQTLSFHWLRGAALGAKMNEFEVVVPFLGLDSFTKPKLSLTMPNHAFMAFFKVADALFAIVHFFCNLDCTCKANGT